MSHNDLHVRPISSAEHSAFLETAHDVSFLQRPEWARVKGGWRGESLGFFDQDELVGTALVLHRAAPVIKKTLAYVPDGPVIDFQAHPAENVIRPLAAYLKNRGAFQLKMGPGREVRTWAAASVRKNLGKEGFAQLADLELKSSSEQALALNDALLDLGFTKEDVTTKLMDKVRKGGSGVFGPIPMAPNPPDKINDADLKTAVEFILKTG